ncbi:PH domain-containing protein [Nocardioides daejeonensis]|uniref:PH domain-containing protein n=1 Tax=Nocardioides daejeonensis TaxID=1046556 RepID=UPI0013A58E70|nr:PH domain-containing protein [Nocardioides daejeonensis]
MPAASEAAGRPRTWRPLGVRIVGITGGVFLFVIFVAVWVLLPESVQEDFDLFQRITAIVLGIGIASVFWALLRARVEVSDQGLVVVNGYKRRDFEWAQVIAVRLPRGAPWAVLDLADGTTCSVMALQGSDGPRAHAGVEAIREHL